MKQNTPTVASMLDKHVDTTIPVGTGIFAVPWVGLVIECCATGFVVPVGWQS
ncbi:hypothetical protein KX928_23255 [Roseobacter sp. YSTF-M11]|uniref:Uncharacterized protein n=1 Tax=Roseobacter insulae TaxID=2859783 RepID=A0A9X1FZZ8_9RHOB|nr:hypothetical protein [Roseobacter insulae]MBW4710718.1 hypothetical protein [Roseobacter insulae]